MTAVHEHAAPAAGVTLLKELIRERHLKYESFCAEYEKAAARITAGDVPPSRSQYYRWISGQLKGGTPYPDACRVLESMFRPWAVSELFGPPPAAPGAVSAPARPLGDLGVLMAGAREARAVSGSSGRVAGLGTRPRYAAEFKPMACGMVASARTALGLTLGEFAELLESALGWTVMPEAAGRWEWESVPPGDVVLFCQAFLADAHSGSPAAVAAPVARGMDELATRRAARRQR